MADGIVKPGNEVDHIIELNDSNIRDEAIVHGLDNLRTLCWQCHRKRHGQEETGLEAFTTPVPRRELEAGRGKIPLPGIEPEDKPS